MILEHVHSFFNHRIFLASASPRRREILQNIGLHVVPSTFEENLDKNLFQNGAAYALETAKHKAMEVSKRTWLASDLPHLVIGADTVVELEGSILEKPKDAANAESMLSRLSGQRHAVHTGVAMVLPHFTGEDGQLFTRSFSSTTSVDFDELSLSEIRAYIETGEPFGKAGAYGIQGPAGAWVKRIEGCYFNVMGFPLHDFAAEVAALLQSGHL
ncbi:Maf-like protein [Coccomyxa subellipsoidea C-169]|uniref:Maf-like protein n=1 Tax=Coccomyxa subellipsoidea (strain C-169) TaxID=574566 RepID=I0YID8_COCSC|nr:Maf-like protein [Coccomyxa subellipsoidea C-169]EIE18157.1 Maf-like protein [Coccomyxa subellipsoidea C-169]|eukprot:XP_005642701.1 Maf-like protein [Coccomyxa subellipsoidea C-169]